MKGVLAFIRRRVDTSVAFLHVLVRVMLVTTVRIIIRVSVRVLLIGVVMVLSSLVRVEVVRTVTLWYAVVACASSSSSASRISSVLSSVVRVRRLEWVVSASVSV